uniref:Uncharacterized protein n=1 Tax=Panagrolaimus sp. ES5 TaxID=591445 RepID=A0AC34F2Y2_9BILA
MKFISAFALILLVAVATINANQEIRAKRSVSTFGSYGSTSTNNGHVVTHGNNHLTSATSGGNVVSNGNVHNSAVGPQSASHNSHTNVANSGPAGTHHSVSSVHTSHSV